MAKCPDYPNSEAQLFGDKPDKPHLFFCCCLKYVVPHPPFKLTKNIMKLATKIFDKEPESGVEIKCNKCKATHILRMTGGGLWEFEHREEI